MDIKVWHEFGSNHSGYFYVVGIFQTPKDAQEAFDEIRNMLFDIDRWHQKHPDGHKMEREPSYGPLPPEVDYAKKYKVDWPHTIDWPDWAGYNSSYHSFEQAKEQAAACIDHVVEIAGRAVEVTYHVETWMPRQPFDGILQRLGANTIGYDYDYFKVKGNDFDFHNRLTFRAPDEETANRLEHEIRNYLEGDLVSAGNRPPWQDDVGNFEKVLDSSRLLKREHVQVSIRDWQRNYDQQKAFFDLQRQRGTDVPVSALVKLELKRLAIGGQGKFKGVFSRQGLKFQIDDVWFCNNIGLLACMAFLEVQGCVDIDMVYFLKDS